MCIRTQGHMLTSIAALGVFLAVSESADADVECFASDAVDEEPVDVPGCKWT